MEILNTPVIMSNGHLTVSQPASRSVRKAKLKKKVQRPRANANGHSQAEHHMAAAGTLTRTKSLLLAALKVWELKHRIGD